MINNKIVLTLFAIMLMMSFISAESSYTFKQNEQTNLKVPVFDENNNPVNSSTTCYLTVTDKNQAYVINNQEMTYASNGIYNYSFNISTLGLSYASMSCSDGTTSGFSTFTIDVTPSGSESITDGESSSLTAAIIIMLIVAAFFFVLGFKIENIGGKIVLIGTASVLILATLLFSLVSMTQILGEFSTIIEGYSTFWFVVKIIFSIALTGLVVFILWFSYQAFMIRRGFRD